MEADTRLDAEEALYDTTPGTQGTIWDILLTLKGISNENALGLLQFIIQQQGQLSGMPSVVTCCNCKELSLSITAAVDAFYQVQCLQQLLEIALDQPTESQQLKQQRTELLTICYLHQVKPYLEDLAIELKEIRQLVPRAYGGQMSAKHGAGLAAEKG